MEKDPSKYPSELFGWFEEQRLDFEALALLGDLSDVQNWLDLGPRKSLSLGARLSLKLKTEELNRGYPDPDRDEKLRAILEDPNPIYKISIMLCNLNLDGLVDKWMKEQVDWNVIDQLVDHEDWIAKGPGQPEGLVGRLKVQTSPWPLPTLSLRIPSRVQ